MTVIDAHTHIWTGTPGKSYFPPRQNWHICMSWAYATGSGAGAPPFKKDPARLMQKQELRISDPTGEYTVAGMDAAGIDAGIVYTIDYDFVFGQPSGMTVDEKHEKAAELQRRYPGRLLCTAGVDPRRLNAFEIYKRAVEVHGLRGLKLVPAGGFYAWDDMLTPFYEYSLDNGQPVFFCTEVSRGSYRYTRFQEPVHISDMTHDFPDLEVVLCHSGWPYTYWFEQCLNAGASNPNVYLQIDHWVHGWGYGDVPGKLRWERSAVNDEELIVAMLSRAKTAVGAHRMMFGSDAMTGPAYTDPAKSAWGFGLGNLVQWWRDLPTTAAKYGYSWTADEVDLVLGRTAAHVMALKRDPSLEVGHKFGWRKIYPPPR